MADREKILEDFEYAVRRSHGEGWDYVDGLTTEDGFKILELLKEQNGLLGIHQTAEGITFISTGTAQQVEERGRLLGKLFMHEWLEKELLYRGLLTDDIRTVFDEAKDL